jgi:hypothetical protein
MDVGGMSMLALPPPAATGTAPADVGRQFESLLWRMLLESGAFPVASQDDGGVWSVMGGVVTQVLADELARENDLGFGRAMLAQGS